MTLPIASLIDIRTTSNDSFKAFHSRKTPHIFFDLEMIKTFFIDIREQHNE